MIWPATRKEERKDLPVNKKKKFQIVIMLPVIAVLVILGLMSFVLISGSAKEKPPTAFAEAVSAGNHE